MGYKKGQSGNPSGRPKGISDRRVSLRSYIEPHSVELVTKLLEMAKEGDMGAMRLVIDRLIPPLRENRLDIELPDVTSISACSAAQAKVIASVACGELLPSEGDALSGLIENRRKALETSEIEARLSALEAKT